MQKIHGTWQFFEASGHQGYFFEKKNNKKNMFSDMVEGSVCTKLQVCIVFRLVRRSRTNQQTDRPTENRNILEQLLASRGF